MSSRPPADESDLDDLIRRSREARADGTVAFRAMTDDELRAEHAHWDQYVRLSTQWGAALAQAARWRDACAQLLRERGFEVAE